MSPHSVGRFDESTQREYTNKRRRSIYFIREFISMFGELIPVGGGDPIPLLKKRLRIGRREGCDVVLNFANVSGHHCLMEIDEGYWFVRDLSSKNGVRIDGKRIVAGIRRRVDPGVILSVAKHEFEVRYEPAELGAVGTPPQDDMIENMFGQSLLDRAGLTRRKTTEE
ncbi:MAG TPA: FHA domain-containing protein [Pirellulaceae bacterium]|nr:FHA domain-containing protein [Pirellulaceae bacterium]